MIDSHCHLDHEPLFSDLKNVIKRSKDVGIKKILTISTSHESFAKIRDIVHKDEMIYGTIGIHPHETTEDKINSDFILKNLDNNPKLIGIGETGLDFLIPISFDRLITFVKSLSKGSWSRWQWESIIIFFYFLKENINFIYFITFD